MANDPQREAGAEKPVAPRQATTPESQYAATYLRAENEDDDGYDPYSDRPARPEPLFERDPWN